MVEESQKEETKLYDEEGVKPKLPIPDYSKTDQSGKQEITAEEEEQLEMLGSLMS